MKVSKKLTVFETQHMGIHLTVGSQVFDELPVVPLVAGAKDHHPLDLIAGFLGDFRTGQGRENARIDAQHRQQIARLRLAEDGFGMKGPPDFRLVESLEIAGQ